MARRNVALASNGGVASADPDHPPFSGDYPPSGAINGDRTTAGWNAGGGWACGGSVPPTAWWQVEFPSAMAIDEVDVITYGSATAPTLTTTDNVSSYGVKDFTVDYWDGSTWQTAVTVTNNTFVWRQFTGLSFTTTKLRVNVSLAYDTTARLLEVEAWGDDTPVNEARVTRVVRSTLGAPDDDPTARLTRVVRSTLGGPADPAAARLTRVVRSILGRPRDVTFQNAQLAVGLTWLELTTPSGARPAPYSDRPLPDPVTYYRGWKEPRVIEWGKIRRALSVFDGQYETSDFQVTLNDTDRVLRALDDADDLVNATVVVRMITDEGRRALETPRVVYRGLVRDVAPLPGLQYQLTIKDTFVELFSAQTTSQQIPRRTITRTDFENCAQDAVAPSGSGYQTSASATTGATTVTIDSGVGILPPGTQFTFAGHATIYAVSTSTLTDPETSITFSPALTDNVADNEAITVRATFRVTPSAGQRVPFAYGFISDRNVIDSRDVGDGQAPLIYVGDKVLSDGKTYAEFLWTGHACHSPSGQPFPMLYFWNNAVDNLAGGSIYQGGIALTLGDLATEAGSGGRMAVPGYDNWDDLGFTDPYVDYGDRRYTVLYLRGIWRDWALGILPAPDNLGGVPFAVAAYGAEMVGDGSGALIQNAFDQYRHLAKNWCPPVGEGYQSGPWLSAPTFADDPTLPMIDEASFARAQSQSAVYVAGGGFRGDFIVGAGNEAITARELIARLNVSFGCECGFNRNIQFFVSLVNTDLDTTTLETGLGWVRDIFTKQFKIETRTRELYTTLPYRHTRDYFNRVSEGWRSVLTGETETEDTAASSHYQAKTFSQTLNLYMIRGKNRDVDPDEFERGSDTASAVLALKLARYAWVQHLARLQTGPAGFNYELSEVVPITHYEGVGADGWEDVPNRIERIEVDPSSFTTTIETYDLRPQLEA